MPKVMKRLNMRGAARLGPITDEWGGDSICTYCARPVAACAWLRWSRVYAGSKYLDGEDGELAVYCIVVCPYYVQEVGKMYSGGDIVKLRRELLACRDELCRLCGRYEKAYDGACKGCRWDLGEWYGTAKTVKEEKEDKKDE